MNKQIGIYIVGLLMFAAACRKPYTPQVIQVDYKYLVMDGVINATPNGITTITLSRTQTLNDTAAFTLERNASVVIEAEGSGAGIVLTSPAPGSYVSSALNLNPNLRYRLRIATSDGGAYLSDYVAVKQTPPIDSLTWKQKLDSPNKGVDIYVHAHDPSGNTRYYRWDYSETWQYEAPIQGYITLDATGKVVYTDSTTQTFDCWRSASSANLSTATSDALAQDVISYQPVAHVPQNDERMSVRYSVNVRQYGLTKDAYDYWQIIRKSSQQTGSIFDPQPSQVIGNIHNTKDPNQPVIGFVSVSYVTEKRLFIDNRQLADWHFPNSPGSLCQVDTVLTSTTHYPFFTYPDTAYQPWYYVTLPPTTLVARKNCLDCRRKGGSNQKPSFW